MRSTEWRTQMANPYYSYIFRQQPQQITIRSPQNGQELNLFIQPGQQLPRSEELKTSQISVNGEVVHRPTQNLFQIINESNQHDKMPKAKGWDPFGEPDKINKRGRPRLSIEPDKILKLKSANFTNKQIATELSTSERQVYRLLKQMKKEELK